MKAIGRAPEENASFLGSLLVFVVQGKPKGIHHLLGVSLIKDKPDIKKVANDGPRR